MKPTFALDLSREAVALLHRTPKGWLSIGEVPFDAPDLAEGLDYLRKTALGLSPMGMACKLILPNSQVLYTEVHAPGPSREDKRRQIAVALEGRTPYPVTDLVFDWSGKGQTVKVAVVARETLEEAESFAATHRLNPVSFVAIPDAGEFVGEPWFGPSAAAEAILAPGESVDRDREPVVVLHRDPPAEVDLPEAAPPSELPSELAPELPPQFDPEPAAPPAERPLAEPPLVEPPAEDDPLPGLEEALNAALPPAPEPVPEPVAEAAPFAAPDDRTDDLDEAVLAAALAGDLPAMLAVPEPAPSPTLAAEAVPDDWQPDLSEPDLPDPVLPAPVAAAPGTPDVGTPPAPMAVGNATNAPEAAIPVIAPLDEAEEAPFAHVTDTAAFPDDLAQTSPTKPVAPDLDDDLPPAPPAAAMVAFASRRAAAAPAATRPVEAAARPSAPAPAPAPAPASAPAPAPARAAATARAATPPRPAVAPRSFPGLVTAPSIPGTRPRSKGKVDPGLAAALAKSGPVTVKSPARPGGTFGSAAPPRNRTGVAFMVLVGLLLLFLAILAAWSSYFLSQNGAVETDSALLADPVTVVPGIDDEMLADMQDPEGMTESLPEAAGPALAGGDAGALATESLTETADVPVDLVDPVDLAAPVEPVPATADATPAADPAPEVAAEVTPEVAAEVTPEVTPEPAPDTVVATDVTAAQPPVEDQDEIFLSAMDAPPPALDALALPVPSPVLDSTPPAPLPPPAFGTVYQFDAQGLLLPTPEGILSPDGVMLFAGPPPLVPPARSEVAAAAARAAAALTPAPTPEPAAVIPDVGEAPVTAADASLVTAGTGADAVADPLADDAAPLAPADPTLSGFRPRPRPDGLVPDDDAALDSAPVSDFAGLRPLPRPQVVLAAAAATLPADLGAQAASLTAQAEADLAAAAALEAANPSIVAISRRPEPRPADLSRAVEAAVAAAVREPEPEVVAAAAAPDLKPEELAELDEPTAADSGPSIPTNASVAKQATFANAINLSKMNLIGTYGTESRRSALIRQSNGRYKKVEVGDKIDGGTVMAITEGEVRYQKGGKLLTLAMPKA